MGFHGYVEHLTVGQPGCRVFAFVYLWSVLLLPVTVGK